MQSYLGGRGLRIREHRGKECSERIHRSSGAIRLLFPGPIRSFPSHRRQISARHERRERKGGEGWRERIVGGKSNMIDGKLLSNKIPRIYTGRGAETICLAGRTPFPRQENRLPVFLLLHGLFQACFPYG